jgi:hypothetical protein
MQMGCNDNCSGSDASSCVTLTVKVADLNTAYAVSVYRVGDSAGDTVALAALSQERPPNPLPALEKAALLELYSATSGATWVDRRGWAVPTSDPCTSSWVGVSCTGSTPNHVLYVDCFLLWGHEGRVCAVLRGSTTVQCD